MEPVFLLCMTSRTLHGWTIDLGILFLPYEKLSSDVLCYSLSGNYWWCIHSIAGKLSSVMGAKSIGDWGSILLCYRPIKCQPNCLFGMFHYFLFTIARYHGSNGNLDATCLHRVRLIWLWANRSAFIYSHAYMIKWFDDVQLDDPWHKWIWFAWERCDDILTGSPTICMGNKWIYWFARAYMIQDQSVMACHYDWTINQAFV